MQEPADQEEQPDGPKKGKEIKGKAKKAGPKLEILPWYENPNIIMLHRQALEKATDKIKLASNLRKETSSSTMWGPHL